MQVKVYSVCCGKTVNIEDVGDETFSRKILGDGVAVIPEDAYVSAPFDGRVDSVFPTKHALVISDGDVSVMIHIGINTVELKGKPFELLVKEGKKVKKGQPLVKVDYQWIKEHNIDNTVLVILLEKEIKSKIGKGVSVDRNTVLFEC